jgi:hypothetical protein
MIVLLFALSAAVGIALIAVLLLLLNRVRRPGAALGVLTVAVLPVMLAVGFPSSLTALTAFSWMHAPSEGFQAIEATVEDAAPADMPESRYVFPGLLDRDIYIFAVEAYGYAAFDTPEISRQLEPYRSRLEAALEEKGYGVRSSFLRSPVAGGYSWLAEATFLTGQWIDSQERFKQLYGANLPSLPGMFYEGGYYTLTLRPGTVHAPWPEGWELYRFQESLVAHDGDFDYVGPWLSYVAVTDQYAIWTGHNRIRELTRPGGEAAEKPIMAYYQLVSSHTPYNSIPPIIEDWNELGNGDIYNQRAAEIRYFDNTWTGGSQLEEGYVAAISYVYEVLTDYVERVLDAGRNPILIVFGDHQPQRPIRSPQPIFSVPVHVASRDPEVLDHFAARGYEPGMRSSQPPPHPDMSSFFPTLSEIARTPRSAAPVASR